MYFTYSNTNFDIDNFDESYQEGNIGKMILNMTLSDTTQFDTLVQLLRTEPSGDIQITAEEETEVYSGYSFNRANKNYYSNSDGTISRNANITFTK